MDLKQLRESLALWRRRNQYRQRKLDIAHERDDKAGISKWQRLRRLAGTMVRRRIGQIDEYTVHEITTKGGARGIVEQAFTVAHDAGGAQVYVGSDFRPGSGTTSGNVSDHAYNDAYRAARDIGKRGVDLLWGPPSPELDKAAVAVGRAFGRSYGTGRSTIIDTFNWNGYRIQIIWRTPMYGGHLGHIHVGAKRL